MSNNIIEHAEFIFKKICEYAEYEPSNKSTMRIALREDNKQKIKKFQSFSSCECTTLLHNVTVCRFEDTSRIYFAANGCDNLNIDDDDVEHIDFNDEFFIYLVKKMNIGVRKGSAKKEIEDGFLYQQDDSSYSGHDLDEIVSIFDKVVILSFDKDYFLGAMPASELGYYFVSHSNEVLSLPIEDMICLYKKVFLSKNKIPKDNIFMSLTSTHWKHCFLELYRCVEWLYVLPRIMNLKATIGYEKKGSELAKHCIDTLSWRKREEDSLAKLINAAFEKDVKFRDFAYWCQLFSDVNFDAQSVASQIYKLRNQFVHQFDSHDEIKIQNNEKWGELINFTLRLIIVLYNIYDEEIS